MMLLLHTAIAMGGAAVLRPPAFRGPCTVPVAGVLFRYTPPRQLPDQDAITREIEYLRQHMPDGALVVSIDQRNLTDDRALASLLLQMQRKSTYSGKRYVYKVLLPWALTRMGICRALVVDADLVIRVESLLGLLALPDSHLDAARPVLWLAIEQSSAGVRRYRFNVSFNGGIQLWDLEAMRGDRGRQYAEAIQAAANGTWRFGTTGDQAFYTTLNAMRPGFIGTVPYAWNWQVGSTDQDYGIGLITREVDALCLSKCNILHLNWSPFKSLVKEFRHMEAAAACERAGALFANFTRSRYSWPIRKVSECMCRA